MVTVHYMLGNLVKGNLKTEVIVLVIVVDRPRMLEYQVVSIIVGEAGVNDSLQSVLSTQILFKVNLYLEFNTTFNVCTVQSCVVSA